MARKPVVELALRQMERNLGYWLLRMCKLSAERGGWDHTQLDAFVCHITTHGDQVRSRPRLQLCWQWHTSSVAQCLTMANAGVQSPPFKMSHRPREPASKSVCSLEECC